MPEPQTNSTAIAGSSPVPCSPSSLTPETDAHIDALNDDWDVEMASVTTLARKMERQRNIAVAALKSLAAQSGHKSAPGCNCMDCHYIRPIEYAIRDSTSTENEKLRHSAPAEDSNNTKNV